VFAWIQQNFARIAGDAISHFHFDRLGLQFRMAHLSPILDQNYESTRQPGFPGVALLNPFFIFFIRVYLRCPATQKILPNAN
jgi:hypothetical protein